MKKIISTVLAACMLFSITACNNASSNRETILTGDTMDTVNPDISEPNQSIPSDAMITESETETETSVTVGYNNTYKINGVSENGVKELGQKIDSLVIKQMEYTGDYHETDRKYGDHDGKAAFLIEPMTNDEMLGFFWAADLDEEFMGKCFMDCLHMNISHVMESEDWLYGIMLHELQHCILYGYVHGETDAWINELMAQAVTMQVYGQDNEVVRFYAKQLAGRSDMYDSNLISPFAYGESAQAPGARPHRYLQGEMERWWTSASSTSPGCSTGH